MERSLVSSESESQSTDNPKLEKAAWTDLDNLVAVHCQAFPQFYLTSLGPAFLKKYYSQVVDFDGGSLIVCKSGLSVVGFVAGFRNPARFYERMSAQKSRFIVPLAIGLLRKPSLLYRTFGNAMRVNRSKSSDGNFDDSVAELSSIAVSPRYSGHGIGRLLLDSFLETQKELGVKTVLLKTDALSNDRTNRFYVQFGFRILRQFENSNGRLMNEYEFQLVD